MLMRVSKRPPPSDGQYLDDSAAHVHQVGQAVAGHVGEEHAGFRQHHVGRAVPVARCA